MLPSFRTFKYDTFRACERLRVRPEGIEESWETCDAVAQAEILAYSHIRDKEEEELRIKQLEASGMRM